MFAANAAATSAKSGEKFFDGASAGNFGVGASDSCERVRIAASDADFSVGDCETFGFLIGAEPHLAVASFESQGVRSEPFEVFDLAVTGKAGEDVVHAVENLAFGEVHEERKEIGAATLDFDVVALGDAVDAEMEFGAGGHRTGDFFAQEEIRAAAKDFDGVDGIVVGDRDDGHAEALGAIVDGFGVVVRLIAKVADERSRDTARCFGVNVKVASHGGSMEERYEQSMKRWKNVGKCVVATY